MNFRGLAARVCGVDLDPRVVDNPMLDEGKIARRRLRTAGQRLGRTGAVSGVAGGGTAEGVRANGERHSAIRLNRTTVAEDR